MPWQKLDRIMFKDRCWPTWSTSAVLSDEIKDGKDVEMSVDLTAGVVRLERKGRTHYVPLGALCEMRLALTAPEPAKK